MKLSHWPIGRSGVPEIRWSVDPMGWYQLIASNEVCLFRGGITLWLWRLHRHGFSMALIEIDGLPFLKIGGSFHGELLVITTYHVMPRGRQRWWISAGLKLMKAGETRRFWVPPQCRSSQSRNRWWIHRENPPKSTIFGHN
jgi:hypothetical protein